MKEFKILQIKESIFEDNNLDAELLRRELKEKGTYLINLMSSPGAGKTTTLTKVINILKEDIKVGVMEADIDSDVDAHTISEKTGAKVIQLHTGGMCHLDADMTRQGIRGLEADGLDLVILENVGNLVCPAEFDTGACVNIMILSVPEGDDKPLKYPLMFEICDLLIINKIDAMEFFDFSMEKVTERVLKLNPKMTILPISAKTSEGVESVAEWILNRVKDYKKS